MGTGTTTLRGRGFPPQAVCQLSGTWLPPRLGRTTTLPRAGKPDRTESPADGSGRALFPRSARSRRHPPPREEVGVDAYDEMAVPDFGDTAWSTPSVKPGPIGPSVIIGHERQGFLMRQLIAIGLGLALLAGCASTDPASEPEIAEPAPATGDDVSDDAGDIDVAIGDFFFDPEMTSVAVGDTVTWTHEGDITHNVTARDGSFASDNLRVGETFTHTFDTAGSFEYRCTLHGQMVATVEVS